MDQFLIIAYLFTFNKSLRNSYLKWYRQYRKLVKYKRKKFTKSIISQLDDLETKYPKTYWKLVNSLKDGDSHPDGPEKSIESDKRYNYFENLNSVDEKYTERIKIIEENLKNLNTVTF